MKPKHHRNVKSSDHFDGIKIEEHKAMDRKLTSSKSRWSWKGECLKYDCLNRDYECDNCIRFDKYEYK